MGKVGEALGSFLALDCEWMRRNPQEPESQSIQRDSAQGKGDWERPCPIPSLLGHSAHRDPVPSHVCSTVKRLLLLDFLYPSEIALELVLLISCTNIIIPITPFLTFAQWGAGRSLFLFCFSNCSLCGYFATGFVLLILWEIYCWFDSFSQSHFLLGMTNAFMSVKFSIFTFCA